MLTCAVAGSARRPLSILVSRSSKSALSIRVSGSSSESGVAVLPFGVMPTLSTVFRTIPPQRFGPYFLRARFTLIASDSKRLFVSHAEGDGPEIPTEHRNKQTAQRPFWKALLNCQVFSREFGLLLGSWTWQQACS